MTSLTIVDAEATARNWVRNVAAIEALVSTRVFFSVDVPYSKAAKAEWIVMTLTSHTFQPGDLGLQLALIQFDCWSPPPVSGGTKLKAATVALALVTAARQLSFGNPITITNPGGPTAVIAWADAQQMRWLPDPQVWAPRYVVDVLFAIHGAEA